MEDLKELLGAAQKKVSRESFGEGDRAFEVDLRLCSRGDLEAMRKRATTRVLDKGTRQFRDDLDLKKLREYLSENCVTGWSGLTFGKAADLCNRTLDDGLAQHAKTDVPCTKGNKDVMLAEALGFEDFVWERVTSLAEEREMGEGRPSSTSATTSRAI